MYVSALLLGVLGVPALAVDIRSTIGRGPSPEPLLLPSNGTFNRTFPTSSFKANRNYTQDIEPNWFNPADPHNNGLPYPWGLSVAVSAPNSSFNASTADTNTITSEISLVWPAGEDGPDAHVNPGSLCVTVVPGLEKFNYDAQKYPHIKGLWYRDSDDLDATECWAALLSARDWTAEGNQTFAEAGCGRTGSVTVPKPCRSYKNCTADETGAQCSVRPYTLTPVEGNITMYSFTHDSMKGGKPFMHRVDVGYEGLKYNVDDSRGAFLNTDWPVIIQNTWEGNGSVEPLTITLTHIGFAEMTREGEDAEVFWKRYDKGYLHSAASRKDLGMGVAMWAGGLALLVVAIVNA